MTERTLFPISKNPEFSPYNLSPQIQDFKTYIFSAPETRNLTTNPFLVGKEYRDALGNAIKKTLNHEELRKLYQNEPDEKLNVLHFLRGGLNFEILDCLGNLGKNKARASFMSSERAKEQGTWIIQDDQYTKLNLAEDSTIFIGDIVATGITLKVALAKIAEKHSGLTYPALPSFIREYSKESVQETKKQLKIKRIIMFALGSEETEKTLVEYHKFVKNPRAEARGVLGFLSTRDLCLLTHELKQGDCANTNARCFKKAFPNFEGTSLIFIEGLFHMANPETSARIKIIGTDLMPWRAILSPEFEQNLYNNPIKAMERCVVYDGGSRGFHPSHHFEDLSEYARQIGEELSKGTTIYDLILDRWENAKNLPEKIKTKLKKSETGDIWLSQRIGQVKARIIN